MRTIFKNNKCILIFFAVITASNLIPVATAGFENCIYCHGTLTFGVPFINLTALNSSIHGRINNMNNLNYACYACHWDGTPPAIHANNRSQIKNCEYCHAGNLFNALQVYEHIQGAQNINIVTSCISCHSNSVDTGAGYTFISDRVAHFGTTSNLMSPVIRSTNCTWCHYDNSGIVIWGAPKDPRTSGTPLGHATFTTNTQCYGCHVYGAGIPPSFHDISLGLGGNKNCISCHDAGGVAPELVDFSAANESVHKDLNSGSMTTLDPNNLRCWACHGEGDGSENAQPPGGHPLNYKVSKNCNSDDCHSISQSRYKETMVYSHFQNSSLNSNPNNGTNYNITTSAQCQACHINSLVKKDNNSDLALASHYGSKDDLVDSFNCAYCHLDKDNSEDWGNATEINKNRTSLIELERERNKLTSFVGESTYLGEGYFLKVNEISTKRGNAFIQLIKNGSIVDEALVNAGSQYTYEKEITIDNSTFKTPIIILNVTSIFGRENKSFIQFEGFRMKKIHIGNENWNSACYACHLYRYSAEKERFVILDKEFKENPRDDVIYYTKIFIDFRPENKSKIYFNDEDYVFSELGSNFGKFLSFSSPQKYVIEGETWNIAENYSLRLNQVSTDSKEAWLTLNINNIVVEDMIVANGSRFEYTPGIRYKEYTETNVTVFTARIGAIMQGKKNFILLQDVVALSPHVLRTTANITLFGYNSSWFKPDDTFTIGRIPVNLHAPNMFDDQRRWPDCVKCHDRSKNLRISEFDAISSRLGRHSGLNTGASNSTFLADTIDRACWACHTIDGLEPQMHYSADFTPRNCPSCHTFQEKPSFGAINISDEPHGFEPNCESCHIIDSHTLIRFEVTPVIREVTLSQKIVDKGGTVKLVAKTNAGYKMKIRAAEYFLDKIGVSGNGTPLKPVDGKFDSEIKDAAAEINASELAAGEHMIYIHAMERNNRWGEFYQANFTVIYTRPEISKSSSSFSAFFLISVLIISYLAVSKAGRKISFFRIFK